MKVQVQAPFSVSEPMQNLIDEKISKLEKFYDRITTAKMFLKDEVNRTNHKEGRTVELQLEVPGTTLFADASEETFEKAIAETADKMERQLKKYKAKLN